MKKVICAKDIDALVKKGEPTLCTDANTIVTPSARDALNKAGITLVDASCEAPAGKAQEPFMAVSKEDEISSETIYKVLKAMLEQGTLKDVLNSPGPSACAPFLSETHETGVKLVRGGNMKMEPLDVGVPNAKVCYREILGKDEAATSSGFLEIENARFDWILEYEETDYVVEGTMTITVDGKTFTAKAGDMFFLPKGAKVVMGSPDKCRIFYTTYPAL